MASRKGFEISNLKIWFRKGEEVEIPVVYENIKQQVEKYASSTKYDVTSYWKSRKNVRGQTCVDIKFSKPISANTINNMLSNMYGKKIKSIYFYLEGNQVIVELC